MTKLWQKALVVFIVVSVAGFLAFDLFRSSRPDSTAERQTTEHSEKQEALPTAVQLQPEGQQRTRSQASAPRPVKDRYRRSSSASKAGQFWDKPLVKDPGSGSQVPRDYQVRARMRTQLPARSPEQTWQASAGQRQQTDLRYLHGLQAEKPAQRPRPPLPEVAQVKASAEQADEAYQKQISRLLEEYKDSPRQAEQLKQILQQLEQHRQRQSDTTDKKRSSQ